MNGRDPVATLLGALDGPVAPRPEFADALLAQLLDELGHGRAPAMPATRRRRRLAARLVPAASPRLRLVLIVIAMLLLAAALAAAAVYFGGRWLSAEPRGIQYSAKFDLTLVMRTPREQALWTQWRLGPGGHDVYVLRHPREPGPSGKEMDLMRVPAVATASRPVRPERLLASGELADPELWEPGVDVEGAAIGPYLPQTPGISGWDALAVADNGDVFVVAGAWEKAGEDDPAAPPIATSLIVRHGDGRLERVLSIDELELSVPERDVELHIAASAAGRLWLMAWELRSGRVSPAGPYGPYSFFEVRDPDGDGDWADRTVRRLALPRSLPVYDRGADGRQQTFLTQIVAEPPLRGQAPSFLVASLDRGERFRVHRIADRNGDGDALDGDEVRRVVDEQPRHLDDAAPAIAARVLDGEREIVAAGLTRRTRLSIVSSSGRVTDVARAFEHLEPAVLAGPGGRLYAPAQVPGRRGSSWRLYRLEPAQQASRAAARPPSAPPAAAPASGTSRDIARIAFTIRSGDFRRGRIVLVRADGKGRRSGWWPASTTTASASRRTASGWPTTPTRRRRTSSSSTSPDRTARTPARSASVRSASGAASPRAGC